MAASAPVPVDEWAPLGRPGDLVWSPAGSALAFYAPNTDEPTAQDISTLHIAADAFPISGTVRAAIPALLFSTPAAARQCAVFWVHGGPHIQEDPCNPPVQTLVAAGFAVWAPVYRGSTGHGEE